MILKKEQDLNTKVTIEQSKEQEQESRIEFDTRIIPHQGHTVFEINTKTLDVVKAQFEETDLIFDPKYTKGKMLNVERKIIKKEGFVYVSALNKKNAIKNYHKGCNGSSIDFNKEYLELDYEFHTKRTDPIRRPQSVV